MVALARAFLHSFYEMLLAFATSESHGFPASSATPQSCCLILPALRLLASWFRPSVPLPSALQRGYLRHCRTIDFGCPSPDGYHSSAVSRTFFLLSTVCPANSGFASGQRILYRVWRSGPHAGDYPREATQNRSRVQTYIKRHGCGVVSTAQVLSPVASVSLDTGRCDRGLQKPSYAAARAAPFRTGS